MLSHAKNTPHDGSVIQGRSVSIIQPMGSSGCLWKLRMINGIIIIAICLYRGVVHSVLNVTYVQHIAMCHEPKSIRSSTFIHNSIINLQTSHASNNLHQLTIHKRTHFKVAALPRFSLGLRKLIVKNFYGYNYV